MAALGLSGAELAHEREIVAFMDAYASERYNATGEIPSKMWTAIRNMHAQYL